MRYIFQSFLHWLELLDEPRRWESISETGGLISVRNVDTLVDHWGERRLVHLSALGRALDLASSDHCV